MGTTRKQLAQALAEACPLDDGAIYRVADVERILAVLPDVLVAQLAVDEDVDIPGVCKIKRKARAPKHSHLTGGTVPAGWTLRASLTKAIKEKVKEAVPAPDL